MGKLKDKKGYVRVPAEGHPRAYIGKVHEHILVMEKYLGRPLPDGSIVHHRNRKRDDNRIENLLLMRNEDDHLSLHRAMTAGNMPIVQAIEEWCREFMDNLKAGLPEAKCFTSERSEYQENDNEPATTDRTLELQMRLFAELRKERKRLADENGVPAYIIFHDKTLREMCEIMPSSELEMLQVSGVGSQKLRLFGGYFIAVVKKFKKDFKITR